MPDCYYLARVRGPGAAGDEESPGKTLEELEASARSCAEENGGTNVRVKRRRDDPTRAEVRIHYPGRPEAEEKLDDNETCLKRDGHAIEDREVRD